MSRDHDGEGPSFGGAEMAACLVILVLFSALVWAVYEVRDLRAQLEDARAEIATLRSGQGMEEF